jgi:RimJ/RimL family protein N-acetyltransferase
VNDSVRLGPLRDEDSDLLFRWINDRDLVVFNAPFRPVSRADHDSWFEGVRERDDTHIYAIRLVDQLVGTCQLHGLDPTHRSAELQIRIGDRSTWGGGIGTAAVTELLRLGFGELGLHRIHLHVFATNERARRLYRRAGFQEEGTLREAAFVEGEWMDIVVMAVLESDPR